MARARSVVRVATAVLATVLLAVPLSAQGNRRLDGRQRAALIAMLDAVDKAQRDLPSGVDVDWGGHVLKGSDGRAYAPFSVALNGALGGIRSMAVYVRAVPRTDGPGPVQHSAVRDSLLNGDVIAHSETVSVGNGEMPVGSPASRVGSRGRQGVSDASTALALQEKANERHRAAAQGTSPSVFPFEDFDFVDLKPLSATESRTLDRAIALPPGTYDVYVALLDRARPRDAASVVIRRSLTVPDFWNRKLALSSLMVVEDIQPLAAGLKPDERRQRPYALGAFEVHPVTTGWFTAGEAFTVLLQICNYAAPQADLSVEYDFYRNVGGKKEFFNRTSPQRLTDADLPSAISDTQTFTMQSVSLESFPPGSYELQVTVRDFRGSSSAVGAVPFTVIGTGGER